MGLQLFAGAALGLLLGLLVGLSSSPVVSTVVGALAGGMLVLLGLVRKSAADSNDNKQSAPEWRLAGFGVSCALTLCVGLYIRTHNYLTPTIKDQIADLTAAGFTADEAHVWIAYKNIGILLKERGDVELDKDRAGSKIAQSVLFATPGTDSCPLFDPGKYANNDEHLTALRNAGDKFVGFADSISSLDERSRTVVFNATKRLFCP